MGLNVRGTPIQYHVKEKRQSRCLGTSAPLAPVDGCLSLRVLVDRSSIEIFTADGRVNMAYCFLPPPDNRNLAVTAQNGNAAVRTLDVWQLKSIWPNSPPL